jgi:hypothetical protein
LSEYGYALGGNNIARSVMHSKTMIKYGFTYTLRLFWNKFGDTPADHNQARVKENLEVVDGRRAGC